MLSFFLLPHRIQIYIKTRAFFGQGGGALHPADIPPMPNPLCSGTMGVGSPCLCPCPTRVQPHPEGPHSLSPKWGLDQGRGDRLIRRKGSRNSQLTAYHIRSVCMSVRSCVGPPVRRHVSHSICCFALCFFPSSETQRRKPWKFGGIGDRRASGVSFFFGRNW